ncbi:hypothetical protein [Flagellimonas zhangzhouensis]|uniref:Uncharacterized protein n=1 Tax=Flagellimonas zhangzhouensis TaxID=1073328 RepID=A0A1H2RP40_9FLAO|nr:hypothetical protein [Allomuricauda zhangzhouensis]SDQ66180.1 hypothetical protein SAMN05216294_2095 [Allomuricauda zhangzhouensis]SDW21181.1 hypothetical protein SAMN04487892_0743 [Allomuricauda zhangzhouensis]
MKKDSKNRFNTPEGYFENFNERLMDRIHKEEMGETGSLIPKSDGFRVPDNYFKEVTPAILSKTKEEKPKVFQLKSYSSFYYAAAAIAAIFILFFNITKNTTTPDINFDDLASTELDAYFEKADLNMTSYEIAEVAAFNETELNDLLYNNLEDDIIIEYMNNNIEDFELEEFNLDNNNDE